MTKERVQTITRMSITFNVGSKQSHVLISITAQIDCIWCYYFLWYYINKHSVSM